jgi:hypothetical protein
VTSSTTGQVAAQQLRREDAGSGLIWVAGGLDCIAQSLSTELDGPKAGEAVDDLLRLMVVLGDVRGAPDLAADLSHILQSVPGASGVLRRRHVGVGGIDQVRRFAQREGRAPVMRAPSNESIVPEGATPLRALIDPHGQNSAQAIARRRRERQYGG